MSPEAVFQYGWSQLTGRSIASAIALTLLYYDYALTFDLERRLFWTRKSFKQWGSILFFLNRYCAVIGYIPFVIQKFVRQGSPLYPLCLPAHPYADVLVFVLQTVIGATFITRTHALYERSWAVLVGLTSLAIALVVLCAFMISQEKERMMPPLNLLGPLVCTIGMTRSQAWHTAVTWGGVMIFDFVVVVLTIIRTMKIKRRSRKVHTLTDLLMRDGVIYFGVISLTILSSIITLLHGADGSREVLSIMTNPISSVLVSRMTLNLREPDGCPLMAIATGPGSSASPSTILSHELTHIGDVEEEEEEAVVHESLNLQDVYEETASVTKGKAILRQDPRCVAHGLLDYPC